jgi:threonyl-tRNA synthetase
MKIMLNNGTVSECTDKNEELHIIRHTAAHILAQAIKRLYPHASFAYGPANEKGFYYDVDLGDTKLTDNDLATIEKEMKKITKENLPIKAFTLPRDEAIKLMEERNEKYRHRKSGNEDSPDCLRSACISWCWIVGEGL